jgi:hypothetical protein
MAFHNAPQFAVGSSESLFVWFVLVFEFVLGGRGGGRRLNLGGAGTTIQRA